ncbi:hypothetical protein ATO12_14815 [Aquimarina atlantica]|uniref:Uncharacterized protein n=1 Tax=Aquimarina atlantica TaxID=1317122 RepID=A0A023BWX5_9FLAO|nr:hypothetical protein [Aquimarina atlantica]EZH74143.1 hypothetical protein ATO12_14815 [Aquimarina atlantica]
MVTAIITKEEISRANVSKAYKESILNAYEYAQEDEEGYFFDAACKVFRYILELTDELPKEKLNGIIYDDLIDDSASWSEIDTRIVKVIVQHVSKNEDEEYPDFFELSSWLFDRLENVNTDDFASKILNILQEKGLVESERDMILSLVVAHSVILIRNEQTTSFGKIALSYIDEILALVKKEEESEAIYQIYLLLKKEKPEQFKNRFEALLEDMIQSGTNGRYYAIMATEQDDPERALEYAKEESIDKYISTAYRVCFYAKGNAKEKYKKLLFALYKEHGMNTERSKRVLQIWGKEDRLTILEQLKANRK